MHEMSLVQALLEPVDGLWQGHGATRVLAVRAVLD